jgi:hypothetical protein
MNKSKRVGFMIYGGEGQQRSVFTDEKYKLLAEYVVEAGVHVESITYNNTRAQALSSELATLDGLVVWVNPIEQGEDRSLLDTLLSELSSQGVMVSTHPETIMKIGTKRVLFDTRDMAWGSDVAMYQNFADFRNEFLKSLEHEQIRVLKQFRGDGGNGVFKVCYADPSHQSISVLHAKRGSTEEVKSIEQFFSDFMAYFANGKPLISQEWNNHIKNGVVRCYMTADRVAGFGYQEINALYPSDAGVIPPGRRYYFTEQCALFADLKQRMEQSWLADLTERFGLSRDALPVIWDADFFMNEVYGTSAQKYSLCEINVSCVSPFPESAIPLICAEVERRIERRA